MDVRYSPLATLQSHEQTPSRSGVAAPDAARKAAREFEAVFLTQTVDEMMKSVDIGSFGGGQAEEIWRGFMARAYADQMAQQGGTGIARSVEATIRAYGRTVGVAR